MEYSTKVNGWETCATVLENKNGPTEQFTKANGEITRLKEKVSSPTPMATIMKDSGRMIKQMAMECSYT
jgi:hypothetical protein